MKQLEYRDIVTRDGTDEHLVFPVDVGYGTVNVMCIKEPKSKWITKFETEGNMHDRYKFLNKCINPEYWEDQ